MTTLLFLDYVLLQASPSPKRFPSPPPFFTLERNFLPVVRMRFLRFREGPIVLLSFSISGHHFLTRCISWRPITVSPSLCGSFAQQISSSLSPQFLLTIRLEVFEALFILVMFCFIFLSEVTSSALRVSLGDSFFFFFF